MSINRNMAFGHAVTIVNAALGAGAVKLEGPCTGGAAPGRLAADIAYINGLINAVAENLIKESQDQGDTKY